MRKIIVTTFTIFTLMLIADGIQPNGTGTEESPYEISSLDNLLWVSTTQEAWDKHFIQTADIDASDTQNWNNGEGFSPIGINYDLTFRGSYDGQNYYISGIFINNSTYDFCALFGVVYNGVVRNVSIQEFYIFGSDFGRVSLLLHN